MRAIDHYREAEELLHNDGRPGVVAAAQVHALLALAGATALQAYSSGDEPELAEWQAAAGGEG